MGTVLEVEIDVRELERVWKRAADKLERDVERASKDAAEYGLRAATNNHTYQDHTPVDGLTDSARVEEDPRGGYLILWPVEYASFVDQGTSRARAFPFSPVATKAARGKLEHDAEEAIADFVRALER